MRILGFLLALQLMLFAHPHIFIETHVSIEKEKIWIVWSFDEMTSALLIGDYDTNKDKKLDGSEIAFLKKDHFIPLAPYSYFMHSATRNAQEEQSITQIEDFTASIENNKLTYLFSILAPKQKQYELRFYDGEMYVAMIVKPKFLTCKKPIQCNVEGYDADFYYGYKVIVSQ